MSVHADTDIYCNCGCEYTWGAGRTATMKELGCTAEEADALMEMEQAEQVEYFKSMEGKSDAEAFEIVVAQMLASLGVSLSEDAE